MFEKKNIFIFVDSMPLLISDGADPIHPSSLDNTIVEEGSIHVPFSNPFLASLPVVFTNFILNSGMVPAKSIFKHIVVLIRRKGLKIS